jgi:hypothetical protein
MIDKKGINSSLEKYSKMASKENLIKVCWMTYKIKRESQFCKNRRLALEMRMEILLDVRIVMGHL